MTRQETEDTVAGLATVEVLEDGIAGIPLMQGVYLCATGLQLPPRMTFDQWEAVGKTLLHLGRGVQWAIGDWLCEGERRYGERYAQAVEITGYKEPTLPTIKWVASRIPRYMRMEELSWSHHRIVASIEGQGEQRYWLDRAIDEAWSTRELQYEIRRAEMAEQEPVALPDEQEHGEVSTFASEIGTTVADQLWDATRDMVALVESAHPNTIAECRALWPEWWTQWERIAAIWRDQHDAGDWGWS